MGSAGRCLEEQIAKKCLDREGLGHKVLEKKKKPPPATRLEAIHVVFW